MLEVKTVGVFLEEPHLAVAASAGRFAAERLAALPVAEDDGAARRQAREVLALLGEAGLCRFVVPAAHGGARERVDSLSLCVIRENLAQASPLADAVFALQGLGSMPIALAGTDEQKERWLPGVASGETMTAFAMTEPAAGSDVRAIETVARREGDDYVLDGRKWLISNAGLADVYTTFAAVDSADGRDKPIACFLVAAENPGLRFAGPQILSAPHPLGEIVFEDCRVGASARLGDEDEGFKLGMRTLDRLRATVAAAACGMASRALDEALAHAKERRQFGRALSEFQLVQQKLALMATDLAAARLLTYRAAWEAENGDRVTLCSAMAKLAATETAQRVIDQAVQILGGRGVLASHPVDHLYRAVRALRIYEGTSEIQQLVIARELLAERG
ncbi:MAG: acyl-CoA dehydrogenase family protein [Acidobacteriota bacterium]|nr:acyl-CoA dehydrogenase family protein [Acidobacteriota bacterium]